MSMALERKRPFTYLICVAIGEKNEVMVEQASYSFSSWGLPSTASIKLD